MERIRHTIDRFRDTTVLVPLAAPDDGGRGFLTADFGGVRWIHAFTDESAANRFDVLGKLDTAALREVVLMRALPAKQPTRSPWEAEAHDFPSALRKAQLWLDKAYGGEAELVAPAPQDEILRGWVFACNTKRHLREGRWQDAMLDAALIVPKEAVAPFGLPNSDPWTWLNHWDAGGTPGSGGFPAPPPPARAAWFDATMSDLGPVLSANERADWDAVMDELRAFPLDARAVVWVRRLDARGRETVGWLLNAVHTAQGVALIDGASNSVPALDQAGVRAVHVIRYR